jgi:integrase
MAYGGLRRGELLGLDWDDIDLSRRLLRVRKAKGAGGRRSRSSGSSRRMLDAYIVSCTGSVASQITVPRNTVQTDRKKCPAHARNLEFRAYASEEKR